MVVVQVADVGIAGSVQLQGGELADTPGGVHGLGLPSAALGLPGVLQAGAVVAEVGGSVLSQGQRGQAAARGVYGLGDPAGPLGLIGVPHTRLAAIADVDLVAWIDGQGGAAFPRRILGVDDLGDPAALSLVGVAQVIVGAAAVVADVRPAVAVEGQGDVTTGRPGADHGLGNPAAGILVGVSQLGITGDGSGAVVVTDVGIAGIVQGQRGPAAHAPSPSPHIHRLDVPARIVLPGVLQIAVAGVGDVRIAARVQGQRGVAEDAPGAVDGLGVPATAVAVGVLRVCAGSCQSS